MVSPPTSLHVIEHLKANGASLFTPLVGADDVDFVVRCGDGQYVELRLLEPVAGGRAFTIDRFRPKPYVFSFVLKARRPGLCHPTSSSASPTDRLVRHLGRST